MRAPEAIPTLRALRSGLLLALCASEAAAQSWLDSVVEINALSAAGHLAEAVDLGPRLIEIASREFGESSTQLAEAHLIVAENLISIGDSESAEDNILSGLAIYERINGAESPAVIDTYIFLGDAYMAAERHGAAYDSYSQARSLIRRNYGLSSPAQVESMRKMAIAADALGIIEEGVDLQREALALFNTTMPARLQSVEANRNFAEWLSRRGYHAEAAQHYERAGWALRDVYPVGGVFFLLRAAEQYRFAGPDADADAEIIPPRFYITLNALNELERLGVPRLGGDETLLRAVLWLELGNGALVFGMPGMVEQGYRTAWETLALVDNGDEIREQLFSEPVPIRLVPMESKKLSNEPYASSGFIELRFTVDTGGNAKDIEVVSAEPEGLLDRAAIRQVHRSRFRPRIENGSAVEGTATITLEFSYDPERADE